MIAAIEDGVSDAGGGGEKGPPPPPRAHGPPPLPVSESRRLGAWYRRYREKKKIPQKKKTGEMEARKQGQPSRSKLDAHEVFILGLIEEAPDFTLARDRGAPCR